MAGSMDIKTEFAAKESPYINVKSWGYTQKMEILSLTTACNMELYKFPFDTQICNITFKSLMYSEQNELQVYGYLKNTHNTDTQSNQSFQIPGEWQLANLTESHVNGGNVFQMTIKRKPLVYVINLIFPVFCFLVLDVGSFFINASQGDKLSFKVTLLLSISVLLQVLNDRLTATNNGIPLIGVYCGVVFTLIGFSILETILVNVLKAKGKKAKSATPENTKTAVTGPGRLPNQQTGEFFSWVGAKISGTAAPQDQGLVKPSFRDHVNDLNNSLETSGNEEPTCMLNIGKKSSLWTKAAKIIDVTFIVLYIITIIVFLSIIGSKWLK